MFRFTQSFFFLGIVLAAAASDKVPTGLSAFDWTHIRTEYQRNRHSAYRVGSEFHARNARQQWLTRFDERGFVLQPNAGGWQWGLALESYGYSGHEHTIKSPAQVTPEKERVTYNWDANIQEWFVNDSRGLEHGFTLQQRPAGAGEQLVMRMTVRGGLRPRVQADGLGLTFHDSAGQAVLQYAGLKAWDADGKSLPAQLTAAGESLRLELDDRTARYPVTIDPTATFVQQAYVKPSNTGEQDLFGQSVAISGDTVVVGAPDEDSSTNGVNSTPNENADGAGAAYVFVRKPGTWTQQAYLKASNTAEFDQFGGSVAISDDTVVVGAAEQDENADSAGAAYVFVRNAGKWTQQAFLTASNPGAGYHFGSSVSISGNTLVVGAKDEASSTTEINSTPDASAPSAGAAYVFVRSGSNWTQQAYLKASNAEQYDNFGISVGLSGETVVVGAVAESSSTTGVNSTPNENALSAGAAYAFARNGSSWTQQAYLKSSNAGYLHYFGWSVAISGETVLVGAPGESSSSTGVNSTPDENAPDSGAAYVFVSNSGTWTQQAYLKPSNTASSTNFGSSAAISGDTVLVGAPYEDGSAAEFGGLPFPTGAPDSGAAHVFVRSAGVWSQQAHIKPSNPEESDFFGSSVAISGDTVVVAATGEDSSSTGINSNQSADTAPSSGAAYIFAMPCGGGRTMPAGQWSMLSLPCAASAPSTVSSVFSGISGTYGTDWVVWERDEPNNRYTKLELESPLTQGNGYWFKSLNEAQFSVVGTSTPVVTSSDCPSSSGCFEITLTKPVNADGLYNLAGHPFPSSVDWANVRVVSNNARANSPSQADSAGDMSKNYWTWSGSGYDTYDDSTPGLEGQLQSSCGMWVKVLKPSLTSIKLLIPAASETTTTGLAGVIKKGALKATEWYVRLVAEVPAERLKDRGNVLGQLKDSKIGVDKHDLPELAPSFTPYLTVVFPGEHASDFHPVKAVADNWSFVVRTDNPARRVRLSWVSGKAPANMSLKDVKTGKTVARKAGSYTFVMGAKERAFTWSVK